MNSLNTGKTVCRKYPLDQTYFDIIDTPDKAYFLGILYADGYNNTKRGAISINLQERDTDILVQLSALIQPSKPLQLVTYHNSNLSRQYRLTICSRKISTRLSELGCTDKKTFTLKFPTNDQVNKSLLSHFVRGYFDGDGHISKSKKKYFSLVGTNDFLLSLQELLVTELGFNKNKMIPRFPERDNNINTLAYCGRLQCLKFGDWMYRDAELYLKRKKEAFDACNIK